MSDLNVGIQKYIIRVDAVWINEKKRWNAHCLEAKFISNTCWV